MSTTPEPPVTDDPPPAPTWTPTARPWQETEVPAGAEPGSPTWAYPGGAYPPPPAGPYGGTTTNPYGGTTPNPYGGTTAPYSAGPYSAGPYSAGQGAYGAAPAGPGTYGAPAAGGSHGGGGGPVGPWGGPPGGWGSAPAKRPRRDRWTIALAAFVALATGIVGVVIGTQLGNRSPAATSSPPFSSDVPNTPSRPFTPGTEPNTNNGSAPTGQAAAVANKVDPSVVDIDIRYGFGNTVGAGTGIVLSANGEILTNNHVIEGATAIRVTSVTTGAVYSASVVGTDPTEDIAVIQLAKASGLTVAKTAASVPAVGDSIVAIGNAGGVGGTPAVVTGVVQALNQPISVSDQTGAAVEHLSGLIQTNAPIQPGDSGGPLANSASEVIGIDTAASVNNQYNPLNAVGFAIPIAHAITLARQIESGQASSTVHIGLPGLLGVEVAASSTGTSGAVVADVSSGGPAATAGIVATDTITAFDGKPVTSGQSLTTLVHKTRPGDKATVTWTDGTGASHTANVTLTTGPPD